MRPMKIGDILEEVLDEMLEGLQIIDPEWRYVYVNETVARQARRTKESLLGRTMMECFPGIEDTHLFEQLRKAMNDRLNVRMENEFSYPDGTAGWFQLYIHPVTDGIMVLSADITARKVSEGLLRQKIEELDRVMGLAPGRELQLAEMKRMVERLKDLAPAFEPKVELY